MSVIAIISLIASVAPKLISAGTSIYELWQDAASIIKDAEGNNGVVNPEAYEALVTKCHEAIVVITKRAEEAQQFLDRDPA